MYTADSERYSRMTYQRCGRSGLKLPLISLGLWHNFGGVDTLENSRDMLRTAFDLGITHFDLANNYGPPPGSAEETFGTLLKQDFRQYRDEFIISTKAGYLMWDGPYGEWGSRKYISASLDQSLKRMGLDYVDIFYSHRFDPETPLEETMGALDSAVRQGKALYAGISNYPAEQTVKAAAILKELGTPCLIHQQVYNMFNRDAERSVLPTAAKLGIGVIVFCPLAKGLLTPRYLNDVPDDSRAARESSPFLNRKDVELKLEQIRHLNNIALGRGQSLAQMALAWVLRRSEVTSALIGASRPSQIIDNVGALEKAGFTDSELAAIEEILAG